VAKAYRTGAAYSVMRMSAPIDRSAGPRDHLVHDAADGGGAFRAHLLDAAAPERILAGVGEEREHGLDGGGDLDRPGCGGHEAIIVRRRALRKVRTAGAPRGGPARRSSRGADRNIALPQKPAPL